MDRDYHYDMIKVLACNAGFEEHEAQLVAYACQYVDDANEFSAMAFDNLEALKKAAPEIVALDLTPGDRFDRVCTGHDDLQAMGGALSYAQFNTYLPFHFIPADVKGAAGQGRYDYTTKPDCRIGRELVEQAVAAVRGAKGAAARDQALIRLGIALHSYIDSWAHKDFSGLYSQQDNSVANFQLMDKDDVYRHILIDFAASVVPETGHAKAHRYPDCSHHRWLYRNPVTRQTFIRDNPALYMEAAQKAYGHLLAASGGKDLWSEIAPRVEAATKFYPPSGGDPADPLSVAVMAEKKAFYLRTFPQAGLGELGPDGQVRTNAYDPLAWKRQAYSVTERETGKPVDIADDRLKVTDGGGVARSIQHAFTGEPYVYHFKGGLNWVWFHIEAQRQRRYVHSRIDTPAAGADPGSLTEAALYDIGVGSQLMSTLGNLTSRGVSEVGDGIESKQRAIAAWRPLGLDLGFLGPAADLESKKAWMRVTVQNSTPWLLTWTGDPLNDFKFADEVVAPVQGGSIWRDMANMGASFLNAAHSALGDVGHGEYRGEPQTVPRNSMRGFAMCERDNALSLMGGVTQFRLDSGGGGLDLTVAFSVPLDSDARSLAVAEGHDRQAAWGPLGAADARPRAWRRTMPDGKVLRVSTVPGPKALIILKIIDPTKEAAMALAYEQRYVGQLPPHAGADGCHLDYISAGHAAGRVWLP